MVQIFSKAGKHAIVSLPKPWGYYAAQAAIHLKQEHIITHTENHQEESVFTYERLQHFKEMIEAESGVRVVLSGENIDA